jgi:subtilisin family serine protease
MAHLLLIASLVGASGVSGLASAGDLELMQMSVAMEKKPWVCQLKSDATVEEVESVTQEFENGKHAGSYVSGVLTEDGLNEVRAKYPVLVVLCEEDPVVLKATEHPVSVGVQRRTYPWGITSINADVVRGRGVGVNVYVMDSGIRISHSEFGGRAFAGVDMITSGSLQVCAPSDTSCAPDGHGHGTHCAGTVGASTYGVADGATLWAVKVIDDSGNGNMFSSLAAEKKF